MSDLIAASSVPFRDKKVRVRVVTSAAEMTSIRDLWDELAKGRTVFQSFLWSQAAAWQFGARERPHIVVAESESGAAIIPAVVRGGAQIALLGEALFDYRDVLAAGDSSVLYAAWGELAALWKPLEVTAICGEEYLAGWQGLGITTFATAPAILFCDLNGEELAAQHRKLGRLSRRLGRKGIELHRHSGANTSLVKAIYEQKARQRNAISSLFTDSCRRDFMQTICALDPRCEVFTYQTESAVVAALVTFREETVRRFYTTYFDPRYAADSPGQLLLYEAAGLTLRDGVDCDFMTGNFGYKERLATRQVQLYKVAATAEELRNFAVMRGTRAA